MFFSYTLTAGVYFLFPYSAPNLNLLILLRCLIGFTMSAPLAHPLVADYIKRSSRGKAIALAGVGMVFGEVLSMGVLFNLTKSMNYFDAFSLASAIIFMFSVFFYVSIVDPDMDSIRNSEDSAHS